MNNREPNDDPDSRVRVARMEGHDFYRRMRMGGWLAGLSSGAMVGGLAFFGLPLWLTLGASTTLVILSVLAMINEIAAKHLIQNAYTQMTTDNVEYEVKRNGERLTSLEFEMEKLNRPARY